MKTNLLCSMLWVALSAAAVFAAERTFTGADGGDWEVATNWIPEGVPTASDEVVITNGWVSLAQSAAIASLQLSGGTLTVGGATASVASQTPLDPGFAGTLSLTVTGDVTVSGQISVGGLRQAARSVLSVGGNLTLDPGGVLAVYAGPTNAAVSFFDGGARVTVAGTMHVGNGSTIYPDCDPVTGAGVVFDLGAIELDKGGSFNAESRGFDWTEYTGSAPAGSVTWANEGKTYYTFAPGRGRDYGAGGGYGGPGGGMSTYGGIPYGLRMARPLPRTCPDRRPAFTKRPWPGVAGSSGSRPRTRSSMACSAPMIRARTTHPTTHAAHPAGPSGFWPMPCNSAATPICAPAAACRPITSPEAAGAFA